MVLPGVLHVRAVSGDRAVEPDSVSASTASSVAALVGDGGARAADRPHLRGVRGRCRSGDRRCGVRRCGVGAADPDARARHLLPERRLRQRAARRSGARTRSSAGRSSSSASTSRPTSRLIPPFGVIGAAIAVVLSEALAFVVVRRLYAAGGLAPRHRFAPVPYPAVRPAVDGRRRAPKFLLPETLVGPLPTVVVGAARWALPTRGARSPAAQCRRRSPRTCLHDSRRLGRSS